MDLDKLQTFCSLMENKTLAEVAKDRKLSISGVQRQITALEKALDQKLFQKQQKLLKPTAEGERFYNHCVKILEQYELALKDIHQDDKEISGDFIIGSTVSSVAGWLTEELGEFIRTYPQIRFTLIGRDLPLERMANECDVFLLPKRGELPGFDYKFIRTFHYNLFASKDYFKEHRVPEKPEDLQQHRIIVYGTENNLVREGQNWHLNYLPKGFHNYLYINNGLGVFKAVENSLGIGIISTYGEAITHRQLIKVLPELNPYSIDIYLIYRQQSLKKQHIDKLYDYLKQVQS